MGDFREGDVVKLKSGGPMMTVGSIGNQMVRCEWFDANKVPQKNDFEQTVLEIYTPPSGPHSSLPRK